MGSCCWTFEPYQGKRLRMLVFLVTTCLLVISTKAASISDEQDTCRAAAEQAGVDFESFHYNVGHMIHSLTVEDVRFFFDENFPVDNDIPTVNTNLTAGPPVLLYTPSFPSKFKFPLGSTLDRILLKNDDTSAAFEKGLTSLEELGHAAHMMEMLYKASQMYKTLPNIDVEAVCPCLVNEDANGIIEELNYIAELVGTTVEAQMDSIEFLDTCTSSQENGVKSSRKGRAMKVYKAFKRETSSRQGRSVWACPNVPEVKDSATWNIFKTDIAGAMTDGIQEQNLSGTNVAIYFYCKIAMLQQ